MLSIHILLVVKVRSEEILGAGTPRPAYCASPFGYRENPGIFRLGLKMYFYVIHPYFVGCKSQIGRNTGRGNAAPSVLCQPVWLQRKPRNISVRAENVFLCYPSIFCWL